jgi:hypothetical protein
VGRGGGGGRAAGPSYIAYTQFAVNAHNLLNFFLMAHMTDAMSWKASTLK